YLTGDLAMRSRRMTQAFESYNQLRVLRRPLTGVYVSFFLMVTLLILFSATWMGSYLAKRITRPVLMLSAAAREIGAGRLGQHVVGQPALAVFDRPDLQPLAGLLAGAGRAVAEPSAQEIAVNREGQEIHLAAVATALFGESGTSEGVVMVFDDVTPLIRAQKVAAWREVARRLAHEIKNPLTPIQLSAERLLRHFAGRPATDRELVEDRKSVVVEEVESLKSLVDEFSQFA